VAPTVKTAPFYQLALAGIGLAVFAGLAVLRLAGMDGLYHSILTGWGVPVDFRPYTPFVDLEEYLASLQCTRAGLDTFLRDPCDILGRPHVYPLWLTPGVVPFATRDTNWLGICLGASFIGTVALIARPRSLGELAVYLLALLSPPTVFAVERGNMDLLVFNLAVFAVSMFRSSGLGRLLAYAVFFFLGTLKFYPIIGIGLALKEKPARFFLVAAVSALGAFGFYYAMRHQLVEMAPNYPDADPISGGVFGGPAFFKTLQIYFSIHFSSHGAALASFSHALYIAAAAVAIAISILLVRKEVLPDFSGDIPGDTDMHFIVGGLLLLSAYFVSINSSYREIYLLMLLPLLFFFRAQSQPGVGRSRRVWTGAIILLLCLLWYPCVAGAVQIFVDGYRLLLALSIVRDGAWWIFTIGAMGLLWLRLLPVKILDILRAGTN
jgi:hypothetical protein